ncbi:hypothetical protein HPB48_011599 [Haemaphysalis longicornis]|uniref:Uncharacterized protein n=1 Tax=Haemaphysalis longicornis TaxID=44386 RepID=A0A9J6GAY5_HAELO|nr:hypothetical protein HPB48_011599 [Haemaphysalis longicornis]
MPREDIIGDVTKGNLFYLSVFYLMVTLTTVMMPQFVLTDAPIAVHYSAFGNVLGYELMHNIDWSFGNLSRKHELTTWYQPE